MNTKAKVLLADDSAFMRKVLKEILTGMGLSDFVEAENGKQALEKVEQDKPDLLILDMIMPELEGMEVLKKIKEAKISVKVLVVSAVGQDSMIEEAKSLGAMGYVVKPFDNDQVVAEVTKAL
jgi:two-component system, chemotaxis family, chemotaxis protein CheY